MIPPFEEASAIRPTGPGTFEATVPDGWQQGRGAFGGLVYGMLARAMEQVVDEPPRRLRTLTGDIAGPVMPGPVRLQVQTLRRGGRQSNLQATLVQEDEPLATVIGVFSSSRDVHPPGFSRETPERADWDQLREFPLQPPSGPHFGRAYEYRSAGPMPFTAGREAETAGYLREQKIPSRRDAASVVALLDAWWPTLWSIDRLYRPMATISFVGQLLVDPARIDPAERLFHTGRMGALEDGFLVELRELWSGDVCVGMNQQTYVVLG
ncbi:MAG TPA: thioesterase family protein [Myxococcaceae bacterium]|nr:thioesterase family protein [Myxococcaceae bacterium]